MVVIGHVEGGTNAGWRRIHEAKQWTHACRSVGGGSLPVTRTLRSYSCPDCGTRRPS